MGVINDTKEPRDIESIRIFFKDGQFIDIQCYNVAINNITDEIILYKGIYITARFYRASIAGYVITTSSDYAIACEED